ncbi:MAG: helix-hairpin-helix domain-containing protein [Saprospiraceae bacterium]
MDFSNFFSNFTSPDSIALLILWVLAFLFGILLGSALRSGTIRRLRNELEAKQAELTTTQGEVTRLTDELHLREADLRKSQFEVEEQRSKATRFNDEKNKLYNEIYALNNELDNLRKAPAGTADTAVVADLNATIERLNGEVATLQTRNQELEAELAQLRAAPAPLEATPEPAEQPFDYLADFQSTQNALRTRLEAMEERLNRLVTENDELRTEMQMLRTSEPQPDAMERSLATAAPMIETEPDWNLGNTEQPRQVILPADEIQRDDLTRIEGIGPFLEKQLNDIGIYRFEQIAKWDGSDIHQVTQQIRYFPGRIERENWVGQAVQLYQQKQQNPEGYDRGTTDIYPNDHYDLKIVEGIGPKIESMLKGAGITTWEELAAADPEQIEAILEEGGNDFHFHNPATWTAQARLAAGGHWELLKEYQEQLKAGRERS